MDSKREFAAEVKATFQDRMVEKFWWYLAFETEKKVAQKVARSFSWARPSSKRRRCLTQSVKLIGGGLLLRTAARAICRCRFPRASCQLRSIAIAC